MDAGLHNLLHNYRITDDPKSSLYTHITLYGPNAKWHVPTNELHTFWLQYCQLVYERRGRFCLAERPQEYMPVLAKLTLRFHTDLPAVDPQGDDFILAVIYCYQQAMLELLQISPEGHELICCVLESEVDFVDNGSLMVQLILQFPYCRTEVTVQTRALRHRVIQLLRTENVVSRLTQQPINDWETILDPLVPQEPWLMYRSTPHPDHPQLLITHIYGKIEHEHIETTTGPEIELGEAFNPINHSHVQQGLIPVDLFSSNTDMMFWVPIFLSVNYWTKVVMPKSKVNVSLGHQSVSSASSSGTRDEGPMDMVDQLLPLLGRDRMETEHYWLDIGRALYNTDNGGTLGLDTWIRFTEQSDNHSADDCRVLYPTFNLNNPLTIKTIAYYAREDSNEAYLAWHKRWCYPAMEKACSLQHTDVATALYRIYWLDFACTSDLRWYWFHTHKYNVLKQDIKVRQYISDDFRKKFETLRTEVSRQIQDSIDDNFKNSAELMIKKMTELIKKLKTVGYKNCLMKEAIEMFHDPNFDQYIDVNPDLMGLIDGILEVCPTYACVRPGKPEDYVSKYCLIYWQPNLSFKHPLVERCMKWLRQVFTDPELLNYFLKLSASCLKGRNSDKLFPILTGEGDNSKSMIKKLFDATFGSYCVTFPTSLITTRRSSSSTPSPELAQAKGARLAFLQEPDTEDSFRSGILKELTGGDTFFARMLHDNGGKTESLFKLFFMCNKVPEIQDSGKAIKNRLRIVPFLSTWVSNPPESEDEQFSQRQFKKDPNFERQIPELAPAFMWILVQKYTKYVEEGLTEPQIINDHTTQYWEDNDIYLQFIDERIETVFLPNSTERDLSVRLTFNNLSPEFNFWYKESYGKTVPNKNTIKHELSQTHRLGKIMDRHGWAGIRLRAPEPANVPNTPSRSHVAGI